MEIIRTATRNECLFCLICYFPHYTFFICNCWKLLGQSAQVLKMKIMNAFKLHVKYLSKSGVREGKCLGQSYLGKKRKKEEKKKPTGKLIKRKLHKVMVVNFFGYAESRRIPLNTSPHLTDVIEYLLQKWVAAKVSTNLPEQRLNHVSNTH